MSKKYKISEERTGFSYQLTLTLGLSSISFLIVSKNDPNERYELNDLQLIDFQNKDKVFKSFTSIQKVYDVLSTKIEKRNYSFLAEPALLKFRFVNEYDEPIFVPLQMSIVPRPGIGSSISPPQYIPPPQPQYIPPPQPQYIPPPQPQYIPPPPQPQEEYVPPPEEVPQPPQEYVPPPEEVPQPPEEYVPPPEEVPQPPEEYVPPPEEGPQPPEEVPQPPEEVPQPPEEVPQPPEEYIPPPEEVPQPPEEPKQPEYIPPPKPEPLRYTPPPPKPYVPPPQPKPYVPPPTKSYVPPQPKVQPYIPAPKPPQAKNLKVGQYITGPTYTAPKTNSYAIPNTDSLKGVKAIYDPSYNAHTSSYNPLVDKKIVKTTLIPDSHRTPWDAPVYKEQVKTGPRYSKIDSVYEIPYVKYPPPYKSGDFFTRLRICVARKKNLAGTLKDLTRRYNDLMVYLNRDMDRIFAGSPSYNDKMYLKDLITKMLCTYHESRDIEHYDDIFKKEVEAKQLKFYGREKEEYDEAMKTLIGTFPYKLAIEYSKMNDNFRKIIAKFFLEKNLRFYKKEEIEDVNIYQQRLMFKTN